MIVHFSPTRPRYLCLAAAAAFVLCAQGLVAETAAPPMPTLSPEQVAIALNTPSYALSQHSARPAEPSPGVAQSSMQPSPSARSTPAAPKATTLSAPPASAARASRAAAAPAVAQAAPGSSLKPQSVSVDPAGGSAGSVSTASAANTTPAAASDPAANDDQIGMASWYGGRFHGRLTASGQVYDMNKMTAANKTLPFGTIVKVTNLENGKSVDVTINDRGPFVAGRIIDLSRGAAEVIGLTSMGVAKVRLHVVKRGKAAPPARPVTAASGTPGSSSGSTLPVIIQVGAFRDLSNAVRLKNFLDQNGFDPLYEKSGKVTRVVLVSVPRVKVASVKDRLAKIGVDSVLVRHE